MVVFEEWESSVLDQNRLSDIVNCLQNSDDMVWYVDRHVVDSLQAVPLANDDLEIAAVLVGISLAQRWDRAASEADGTTCAISGPVLVVDDEWLERRKNATPPHIKLNIAKSAAANQAVDQYFPGARQSSEGLDRQIVDRVRSIGWQIYRLAPTEEDDGAWLICPHLTGATHRPSGSDGQPHPGSDHPNPLI